MKSVPQQQVIVFTFLHNLSYLELWYRLILTSNFIPTNFKFIARLQKYHY